MRKATVTLTLHSGLVTPRNLESAWEDHIASDIDFPPRGSVTSSGAEVGIDGTLLALRVAFPVDSDDPQAVEELMTSFSQQIMGAASRVDLDDLDLPDMEVADARVATSVDVGEAIFFTVEDDACMTTEAARRQIDAAAVALTRAMIDLENVLRGDREIENGDELRTLHLQGNDAVPQIIVEMSRIVDAATDRFDGVLNSWMCEELAIGLEQIADLTAKINAAVEQ